MEEDFFEVVSDFFSFHVECAEALDARGVNDVASSVNFVHLGKGRCVFACIVGIAYFARLEAEVGVQTVYEC